MFVSSSSFFPFFLYYCLTISSCCNAPFVSFLRDVQHLNFRVGCWVLSTCGDRGTLRCIDRQAKATKGRPRRNNQRAGSRRGISRVTCLLPAFSSGGLRR